MNGDIFLGVVVLPIVLILIVRSCIKNNVLLEDHYYYPTDIKTQELNAKRIDFETKNDIVDERPSRGNSPGGLFYDDHGVGFTGGDYSL